MSGPIKKLDFTFSKPETDEDWNRIKELCCLTTAQPIEKSKWPDFSRKWVEPYRKHCSKWTYVAKSDRKIVGYLTGCPSFDSLGDDFFESEFRSLQLFSKESIEKVKSNYSAHLHINFEPEFRGQGLGSQLIQNFSDDLKKMKIPGIHVICGPDPVRFYNHNRFHEIEYIQNIKGRSVFLLGFKI